MTTRTLVILILLAPLAFAQEEGNERDLKLLRQHGIGTDTERLVRFLKLQELSEGDAERITGWLKALGDDDFDVREKASQELLLRAYRCREELEEANRIGDPEVVFRAKAILERLENGLPGKLLLVAIGLLEERKVKEPAGWREAICNLPAREARVVADRYAGVIGEDAPEFEEPRMRYAVGRSLVLLKKQEGLLVLAELATSEGDASRWASDVLEIVAGEEKEDWKGWVSGLPEDFEIDSLFPVVEGFTFLREETFECRDQMHTLAVYRCEVFAKALELEEGRTEPACEFVLVPGGKFMMGWEDGRDSERPVHEVAIEPFLIARTEVTQKVWEGVIGENPSSFKDGEHGTPADTSMYPVEQVRWEDCKRFCEKVGLILPTEAMWEYICRAGSTGKWCHGDDESNLGEYAWLEGNSGGMTHAAGKKKPNAFGLFDIHGNVCEWCEDTPHDDYTGAPNDGTAWAEQGTPDRVMRGGSWAYPAVGCRSAARDRTAASNHDVVIGVRPARSITR